MPSNGGNRHGGSPSETPSRSENVPTARVPSLRWERAAVDGNRTGGRGPVLHLIDQRKLPGVCETIACRTPEEVADAIRSMVVRGAPAIAATAAYGIAMAAHQFAHGSDAGRGGGGGNDFQQRLHAVFDLMRGTRPTAVNLFWGIERMVRRAEALALEGPAAVAAGLEAEADAIATEDVEINRQIGRHGAALVPPGAGILTHCNTGSLATVDYGTALGIIRAAHEGGKNIRVYADETRPFLQGARLTAWELHQDGIDVTLITDSMAGYVMAKGLVQLIVVGADRVAANGDVVNKIGTYPLAVLAEAHGIPFYAAVPLSTIDLATATGKDVTIEERNAREVTHIGDTPVAPDGVRVLNPAFDVTPAQLVTAIVTERGVIHPPYPESLRGLFAGVDS